MDYFLFNFSGVQFHYTMSLKKEKKQRRAQRKETRIGKLTDKASKLAERMHNKVGL